MQMRRREGWEREDPAARNLEFQAQLEGDHARGAIATKADAEQSGGRRGGVGKRAESSLRGGFSWNAREQHAGQPKIRVVENVEELDVKPQLHFLGQWKIL